MKVAFVIASKYFQDEEFFAPKEILEKAGFQVIPVSDRLGLAKGTEGGEVSVSHCLENWPTLDYDILAIAGGKGALKYLDNELSYQLLQRAVKEKKVIGAICIAPLILARAGILEGKKATVWTSPLYKKPIEELKKAGAHYIDSPVVQDGLIVTANGPSAANLFGQKLIEVYQENQPWN